MLLDSNILIYAANGNTPQIESLVTAAENSVASITQIEVFGFGRLNPEEKAALDVLFARLTIHPLDQTVIDRAIALRLAHKTKLADSIIAATALVHGEALVTRNIDDFKNITELEVVNPFV